MNNKEPLLFSGITKMSLCSANKPYPICTNEKLTLRIHGLMQRLQMTKSELKYHAQFMVGMSDDWIDYMNDRGNICSVDDLWFWVDVYSYLQEHKKSTM